MTECDKIGEPPFALGYWWSMLDPLSATWSGLGIQNKILDPASTGCRPIRCGTANTAIFERGLSHTSGTWLLVGLLPTIASGTWSPLDLSLLKVLFWGQIETANESRFCACGLCMNWYWGFPSVLISVSFFASNFVAATSGFSIVSKGLDRNH